jgi:hypothetical protein
MFEHSEQTSPISEGGADIWINVTLQGKNLTTWNREPRRQRKWPPFTMTMKELSQTHRILVPSSTWKPRRVVCGWPEHYLNVIREVQWGCHPTQRLSKLLRLRDPINPLCASTQLNTCCNRAQPTWSLIDTGEATTFEAPNMKTDHSQPPHPVFSTFP